MTAQVSPILKPEASWVTVTPETASRWLTERNTRNRRRRVKVVDQYARDMTSGNWQMTGEAIKFDAEGTLLDGQHRLAAIIKSGVTLTLLVIRNVSPDAQHVMDTGSKRLAADQLSITGHKNTAIVAAAAKIAINLEAGRGDRFSVTHSEIAEWVTDNPGVHAAAAIATAVARKLDIAPATLAYAHLRLAAIDPFDATRFWNDASEKAGLRKNDPVIALSNRFAEARRRNENLSRTVQLGLIYRAWNARRRGETLSVLRLTANGHPIAVPEPI